MLDDGECGHEVELPGLALGQSGIVRVDRVEAPLEMGVIGLHRFDRHAARGDAHSYVEKCARPAPDVEDAGAQGSLVDNDGA